MGSRAIPENVLRPMNDQCLRPLRSCFRLEMSIVQKGPPKEEGSANRDVFSKNVAFILLLQLKKKCCKFSK